MPTKVRGNIRVSTHAGNVFSVYFAIVTRLRRTSFLFLFLIFPLHPPRLKKLFFPDGCSGPLLLLLGRGRLDLALVRDDLPLASLYRLLVKGERDGALERPDLV